MENRRDFLRMSVFGLATASLAGPLVARAATPANGASPSGSSAASPAREAPLWLVHPLRVGDEIGLGWRLARMYPAVDGAVTINLAHDDGRAARVDLCLREGAAKGPASTALIDFIVMDGGDGTAPMDEALGRAVMRLAAIVGDNEGRDLAEVAGLEAHADRVWRHADALSIASKKLSPGVS